MGHVGGQAVGNGNGQIDRFETRQGDSRGLDALTRGWGVAGKNVSGLKNDPQASGLNSCVPITESKERKCSDTDTASVSPPRPLGGNLKRPPVRTFTRCWWECKGHSPLLLGVTPLQGVCAELKTFTQKLVHKYVQRHYS